MTATAEQLTGRTARCAYGCGSTRPSDDPRGLAFFEYRGPGSKDATERCKCGFFKCAHEVEYKQRISLPFELKSPFGRRKTVVEDGKCQGFEPRGAAEFDSYYCGCRGWD